MIEVRIVVLVLSTCCTLTNLFALLCILGNYRRLRQRMYIFIVNLTIVDVIIGVAFMIDAVMKILRPESSMTSQYTNYDASVAIEGLKIASVFMSALNTAVLTYALHKRTTSMGRHRAESVSNDGLGSPHRIPAFDTMLRVLSLGGTQTSNADRKGSRPSNGSPPRYKRTEGNSPKRNNELYENDSQPMTPKKNEVTSRQTPCKDKPEKSRRKKSMARLTALLAPGGNPIPSSRPSVNSRSMMSSTYVGRHGNSVVGVRTTVALLLVIWIAFLVTWLLPVATRLMMKGPHTQMLESFSCPSTCGNARTVAQSWSTTQDDVTKRIFKNKIQMNQSESATLDGWSNSANANMTSHPVTVRRIRHKGRMDGTSNSSATDNTSSNTSSIIATTSSMTQERIAAGNTYEDNQPRDQYCPESCSNLFYPLSKSHVIFQALVITVTWLFMLFTSLRLLWLRRNSKNVFVRCSALWRFILYIALFYLVGYASYISACVADVTSSHVVPDKQATGIVMSNLTFSDVTYNNMTSRLIWGIPHGMLLVEIASCAVVSHSTLAPSLYLVRLLGFRRMVAGIRFR